MKLLIITSLLLCASSSIAVGQAANDLTLRVSMTSGERSRDSSSQTTTLTIGRDVGTIGWAQTFSGRRGGTPPADKEFKLSATDRADLLKLIRANDLLVTKSIELPPARSGYAYFALSLDLTLHGQKGAISISGPRTGSNVKEEKLYQDTLALVRAIYRIIGTQDKTVYFEELVR